MDIKQTYLSMLVEDVEANLARFDEATGRFLTDGGWANTNQDIVYPLALLYATEHPQNPYYQEERILEHALQGGDAWRHYQYPDGRVEFIKVDGSRWGPTYMPWSMYHWLETYALLSDVMDNERRIGWEEGLRLAYTGIAEELETAQVHNIPTWKGMALYRAGQIFGRPEWQQGGRRMIHRAVMEQRPEGYWYEHQGPSVSYNHVYTHAIGLYYEFSDDESVLPCLKRATEFHIRYTYPDGRVMETIDGRVKYHDRIRDAAHAAFSLFPRGRRYVRLLVENMLQKRQRQPSSSPGGLSGRLASAYVHYHDGPEEEIPQDRSKYHIHDEGHAIIRRDAGWLYCQSGFVAPKPESRWGQERQHFVSVWNEDTGLIVGGGNSRNQPAWSNFVLDDGEEVVYVPRAADLSPGDASDVVSLDYGGRICTLEASITGRDRLVLRLDGPAGNSNRAQLLFKIHPDEVLYTEKGGEFTVGSKRLEFTVEEAGGGIEHHGWYLQLPPGSTFTWPVRPFNPYAKDGSAPLEEAVGVLRAPLGSNPVEVVLLLQQD